MSAIYVNSIKDKTNTRELASDSGSAWSWGANVPKGSVIEQFCSPCDGSSITVQSGTYTVENVTAQQDFTTSFVDLTGSSISYTPPTGTQTVIYDFNFFQCHVDTAHIAFYKLFIDGTEVTNFHTSDASQQASYEEKRLHFTWAFNIGGTPSTANGRIASWTSAKTIKIQAKENSSNHEVKAHASSNTGAISIPVIAITALA
jgi:hypothetical protein